MDVNQSRVIWTRWIGVPLQAWCPRFFELSYAQFGRMVEVHDAMMKKSRLDMAYVRISTGLISIDRTMECNIDGKFFQIRVEEVKCLEREILLQSSEDMQSEPDSDYSEMEKWLDVESMEAALGRRSDSDGEGERSVEGGKTTSIPSTRGVAGVEKPTSNSGKSAGHFNNDGSFENWVGPEGNQRERGMEWSGPEQVGSEGLNGLGTIGESGPGLEGNKGVGGLEEDKLGLENKSDDLNEGSINSGPSEESASREEGLSDGESGKEVERLGVGLNIGVGNFKKEGVGKRDLETSRGGKKIRG